MQLCLQLRLHPLELSHSWVLRYFVCESHLHITHLHMRSCSVAMLFVHAFQSVMGASTVPALRCLQYAPAIAAGQWWRLISSNFLHSSWLHLGMNMLAVSNLGAACEKDCGPKRMMAIYSTACLTCSVASYLFTPASSLGASGNSDFT